MWCWRHTGGPIDRAIYCYILLYIAIMNGSELICGAEGTLVVPSDRAIYCYILLYIADYEWE